MAATTPIAELNRRSQQLLDTARASAETPELAAPAIAIQLAHLIAHTGTAGFAHAARFWCDRLVEATPGAAEIAQQDGGTLPSIEVMIADDASFTTLVAAATLPPRQRWACDLIAARMSGHQFQVYNLIIQVPAEPAAMLMHLSVLLSFTAGMLHEYDKTREPSARRPGLWHLKKSSVT